MDIPPFDPLSSLTPFEEDPEKSAQEIRVPTFAMGPLPKVGEHPDTKEGIEALQKELQSPSRGGVVADEIHAFLQGQLFPPPPDSL